MSTIKANDIQNASGGIPTVKSQQLIPTAWVNFDGKGTVAIRDSENVSSITDNGTGSYNVNFSTNMANTTYAVASGCTYEGVTASKRNMTAEVMLQTVSQFTTNTVYSERNSTSSDAEMVSMIVLGGQS